MILQEIKKNMNTDTLNLIYTEIYYLTEYNLSNIITGLNFFHEFGLFTRMDYIGISALILLDSKGKKCDSDHINS